MTTRVDRIALLFPRPVIVEEETPSAVEADLFPEEAATIQRAVEKRRREFAAGRLCARRALSRLGFERTPILPGPDRAPQWPSGAVGSITHTADWCGVAVSRTGPFRGLGIDAEPYEPIKPDLFDRICTDRELAWIATRPPSEHGTLVRLVFSAKEAFYKAQYAVSARYLGFHDVELDVDRVDFSARFLVDVPGHFRAGDSVPGRVATIDGLLVTVAWLDP
jgi:4'-phosphopantetheinyl transferase EntD